MTVDLERLEAPVDAELSSFADLAQVISDLPVIVRAARRMRRLSVRALADEVGVSPMTISRVENGREAEGPTLRLLLLWLDKQGRNES